MENTNFNNFSSQGNRSSSSQDYLQRAASALNSGNKVLAIHLYLAAFEQSLNENIVPSDDSMRGIDKAWSLALETKQRSLAEYIFERLEPFWPQDVSSKRAGELQGLALDKLEEFGFPREALEGVADFMNQDLSQIMPGIAAQVSAPNNGFDIKIENPTASPEQNTSPAFPTPFTQDQKAEDLIEQSTIPPVAKTEPAVQLPKGPLPQIIIPAKKKKSAIEAPKPAQPRFNYSFITGFDTAIEDMKKLGIGRKNDADFKEFVASLNLRHGLPAMPGLGTLLFSCDAREDANYFMVATVGEMEMPAVRMRLDQNAQGQTVLCIMSSADFKQKVNTLAQQGFAGPAIVILEDLDLWDFPEVEFSPENSLFNLAQMQLTRGAREALAMVKAAFENPEVTVFASAQEVRNIDSFFMSLMNSYRVLDIDLPNDAERRKCWRAAQSDHPSMRGLDVNQLVSYSRGMSRFEIFMVTNEAVEDAYRASLASCSFKAVHTDDMFARLSNFQPLDSDEYQEMEDYVVDEFRHKLDFSSSIDELLS